MGMRSAGAPDTASLIVTGNFSAVGTSTPTVIRGEFNFSVWGTWAGQVQLERSFDGGTTWILCRNPDGSSVSFISSPATGASLSVFWREIEPDVLYRVNAVSFTSGAVNYRISQ